jgi:hypothetical protein
VKHDFARPPPFPIIRFKMTAEPLLCLAAKPASVVAVTKASQSTILVVNQDSN